MKKALFALLLCLLPTLAQAQFPDQRQYGASLGGTANAQTMLVYNYALQVGVVLRARMVQTNTGAMTLNVNATGAVVVEKLTPSGLAPLAGGEVVAGQVSEFLYDGTYYELLTTLPFLLYNTGAGTIAVGPNTFNPNNGQAENLYNSAFGVGALAALVNTSSNSAFGYFALNAYTGGGSNVDNSESAFGAQALLHDVTGVFNSAVGSNAGKCVSTAYGSVFFGHGSGGQDDSSPALCTGAYNTAVGAWSGQELTTGSGNTFVGMNSGLNITTGTANATLGLGALCGGYGCTTDNPGGNAASYNVAVGYDALENSTANGQTAVGFSALKSNTTGTLSTALGYNALQASATDTADTAVGYGALYTDAGGSNNTAVGYNAATLLTTGSFNTVVGSGGLGALTTGSYNVAIGYLTYPTGNFSNSVAIGYGVSISASNTVAIGNSSTTDNYFYGVMHNGGSSGVTCATGSPTSSFAAVNGFVTHC